MAVFAGLLILVGALALTVRFGVMAPPTLGMIEARTDGLAIGRLGNLKIEGLRGDLFRSFSIERLTISDEEGVWLEARNIEMTWRYLELLRRRFHAESLTAEQVSILRRPTLTEKKEEAGGLPVVKVVLVSAFLYVFGEPLYVLAKFFFTQLMGIRFTDGPTAVPDNMGREHSF